MRLHTQDLLQDNRNLELLRLLRDDPRMGTSELARRVGMSAPAVRERILRMEEAGIIRSYRLELDPAALGYPVSAYVRVRPTPGQLPKIAELARSVPQVVECHIMAGECDALLRVVAKDLDDYRQFQMAHLSRANGVQTVKNDIPLQKIKLSTELPL